jgi:putative colanic acid biosynthesis acetyltransferase WcaF
LDVQSEPYCLVDLSIPDNSEFSKGRSFAVRSLWHFAGAPVLASRLLAIPALKSWILQLFGARVGKRAYIKPGVRVKFPWYLTIGDYCWIGEDVWIDNLCTVTIGSHVCISQAAYLCTGNHDWNSPNMKLFRQPIEVRDGSWVGARATLCPGTTLDVGAIITVGSIASGHIPPYEIWGGNPARHIRDRQLTQKEQLCAS